MELHAATQWGIFKIYQAKPHGVLLCQRHADTKHKTMTKQVKHNTNVRTPNQLMQRAPLMVITVSN